MIEAIAPALLAELNFGTLPQQLANGILLGAIYALIALGYTMVYGVLRLINFAHGEVFMLGAYTALFVSYAAMANLSDGLAQPLVPPAAVVTLGFGLIVAGLGGGAFSLQKHKRLGEKALLAGVSLLLGVLIVLLGAFQPKAINLSLMLLASMVVCGLIGLLIEALAYRPMRNQPRIASLITAIGVSLFLQFGGQLVLPNSPPPKIDQAVNPYNDPVVLPLVQAPAPLRDQLATAQGEVEVLEAEFDEAIAGGSRFNLTPEAREIRDRLQESQRAARDLEAQVNDRSLVVRVPAGQLIMFGTALALMFALRYLVLHTSTGRAMRAVSHDFESASLMGVNVNRIVAITFLIGSSLAGAGAMMNAAFLGTPLTPFYGVVPGIKAFVAAVLGGIGNIPGAVVGGLLMGVAETLVVWAGGSEMRDAVAFIILIVVLLLRPGGLLGSNKVEKV